MTEQFVRKNTGIVNTDVQSLRAAKARKISSKKIFMLENRIEVIENKIDDIIKVLERLNTHE